MNNGRIVDRLMTTASPGIRAIYRLKLLVQAHFHLRQILVFGGKYLVRVISGRQLVVRREEALDGNSFVSQRTAQRRRDIFQLVALRMVRIDALLVKNILEGIFFSEA